MHAFIVILLALGFTAGVLYTNVDRNQIIASESANQEENAVHIEADINIIDESDCDSIFPIL